MDDPNEVTPGGEHDDKAADSGLTVSARSLGTGFGEPSAQAESGNAPPTDPQLAPAMFASVAAPRSVEPWRTADLFVFVGFSVIWAFLSGVLLLAAYALLRPVMGWHTPAPQLLDNTLFGLAVQIFLYGPVLLYIVLLVSVHYRLPFWQGIAWRWPGAGRAVKLLVGGILLALVVASIAVLLPDRKDFPLEKMFSSTSAAYALGGFAILVAPFMEELIFRGVLFAFFERLAGLRWAVAGTAVLFAALHYPEYQGAWTHLGMILLVGIVFSVARAMTRSVVPSFLLHTGYNATFILALFAATHRFHNLPSCWLAGGW